MMVSDHMHSNISPRVTVVTKEAKFLRRLSLSCLNISWSAWRFGKELVILHKWIATRTSESPTPFVISGAPPNQRLDCISQTVAWGKCLCDSAEDEDGELTEFTERS